MPDPVEDLFLLTWEKVTQRPLLEVIEVEDVEEDNWVRFTYLEPGMEGLTGGAPLSNVLSEKEADLVRKRWAYIDQIRSEAKRLNKEANDLFKTTINELNHKDREGPF